MAITFEIRQSKGYCVHVKALSGRAKLALAHLILDDIHLSPKGLPWEARHIPGALRVKSVRLKRLQSDKGARDWIERFKLLPFDDQMFFLRNKKMFPTEKNFVAIKAQHYQMWATHWGKEINHGTTINKQKAIESILAYGDTAHLTKTVSRNLLIGKEEYEKIKDKIEEKRIDPEGIVGMCQDVKKTRRNRLKSQDRHSGYRTTTSPNFHKGK